MAYVEFNDQEVKEFVYPKYGNPENPLSNRYPKQIRIKYPKTGTTNPTIKINVFDDMTSDTPSELNVDAPDDLGNLHIFQYSLVGYSLFVVIDMSRLSYP